MNKSVSNALNDSAIDIILYIKHIDFWQAVTHEMCEDEEIV